MQEEAQATMHVLRLGPNAGFAIGRTGLTIRRTGLTLLRGRIGHVHHVTYGVATKCVRSQDVFDMFDMCRIAERRKMAETLV